MFLPECVDDKDVRTTCHTTLGYWNHDLRHGKHRYTCIRGYIRVISVEHWLVIRSIICKSNLVCNKVHNQSNYCALKELAIKVRKVVPEGKGLLCMRF